MTATNDWVGTLLACPRDGGGLRAVGDGLLCDEGHEYPIVDGIPVLVSDATPTQPGYWATPEQIEAARREGQESDVHGVDPYVQRLVIGTCGNLYRDVTLTRYPIPEFPLPPGNGRLLLDIGCNWGRWTLAAERAGYTPVGIDPSFEAIAAARRIADKLGSSARFVVADGRHLPFATDSFDVVFSYGVLQHFSKADVRTSLADIGRVTKPGGLTWVQMPNTFGVRSLQQLARRRFSEGREFDVRYWTPRELRETWTQLVGPTRLETDGFFTLSPQAKTELDLLPRRYQALIRASEALRRASGRAGWLTTVADSVHVVSTAR
jgi:SAM-dependent methyltransferase